MIKAYIVIMSHLSDVQETLGSTGIELVRHNNLRINFAKFLILKYASNLEVRIDPDKDFDEFKLKYPTK